MSGNSNIDLFTKIRLGVSVLSTLVNAVFVNGTFVTLPVLKHLDTLGQGC